MKKTVSLAIITMIALSFFVATSLVFGQTATPTPTTTVTPTPTTVVPTSAPSTGFGGF